MILSQGTIVHKTSLAPAWWQFVVNAPALAPKLIPGQFLMLRCGDSSVCYLRRPIFPQRLSDETFCVLIRPTPDPGLSWLLTQQIGDTLDLIGPLGNGFNLPNGVNSLLLVSDDQTIAPLLGLVDTAITRNINVTLALGASRADTLYPATTLPPAVEFQAATFDGSAGHHGPITDLLPDLLSWADVVCATGSAKLLQTLKDKTSIARMGLQSDFLFGLTLTLTPTIACGTGACFACGIQTEAGVKLTCTDGPVFDMAHFNPGGTP